MPLWARALEIWGNRTGFLRGLARDRDKVHVKGSH